MGTSLAKFCALWIAGSAAEISVSISERNPHPDVVCLDITFITAAKITAFLLRQCYCFEMPLSYCLIYHSITNGIPFRLKDVVLLSTAASAFLEPGY